MTQFNSPQPIPEIDITIFVSCYNEESFIAQTLENVTSALQEAGCTYEIIVVDDKSIDNSAERVRQYIHSHPQQPIQLKVSEKNRGLANNYVETAFLGRGKYYRLCCGDNCEPKDSLVRIFRCTGKADMVITYQDPNTDDGRTTGRRLLSRTFTGLVNMISGYRIRYYNGLATHLRYNVMRWHPSSYGFGFQADIITRLLDEGTSYIQIPRLTVERKGTTSTALTMRNILSVIHTLLEITIRRVRRFLYGKDMSQPQEITP